MQTCVKFCNFLPKNFGKSLSAKFPTIYLRNFAEFEDGSGWKEKEEVEEGKI
jgi:hypothetical protein